MIKLHPHFKMHKMKTIIIMLTTCFVATTISAQQAGYRTYSSTTKLVAKQGDQSYQWENSNNTVYLDYKTGDFKARMKNRDFYNPLHPAPSDPNLEQEEREFIFQGILPIYQIINQKNINQQYNVELDLVCDDLRLFETVNFSMTITRPNSSSGNNYRIFSLQGILYNDQLNLPFFEGFNNEIELFIIFNGFFEGG